MGANQTRTLPKSPSEGEIADPRGQSDPPSNRDPPTKRSTTSDLPQPTMIGLPKPKPKVRFNESDPKSKDENKLSASNYAASNKRITIFPQSEDKKDDSSSTSSNIDIQKNTFEYAKMRKSAYFQALGAELKKKEIPNFFVDDAILLSKAYVSSEISLKLFEIASSQSMITIGYETNNNFAKKIRILRFEDLLALNQQLNLASQMSLISNSSFSSIEELQIRINRKKGIFYLFIVQPFFAKSLEKLIMGKFKFSEKEILALVQDTMASYSEFSSRGLDHGGLTPKNIMMRWGNESMRFSLEPRFLSKPTKHLDNYSLGLCLLSAITMQTYDSLSFFSYPVISQMIEGLAPPYFQILDLLINPNPIPVELIAEIIGSIKLYSCQKIQLKRIWEKRYWLKCVLGTKILVCDLQKYRICYLACSASDLLEVTQLIILTRGAFILYKKKSGRFLSFHDLTTLNLFYEKEIELELNEYISLPLSYEPAAIQVFENRIYLLGGEMQGYPTSACFCVENDVVSEIKELSMPSGKGCSFIKENFIVFFHFGKYMGNYELFDQGKNSWHKEKILTQSAKLIANSFLVDLKYAVLGVSKDEAYIFKDQILHLRFQNEETREIVEKFDDEANSRLDVICLADGLFLILKKNRSLGSIELIYFYINSFSATILACKISLEQFLKKLKIKHPTLPDKKSLIESSVIRNSDHERYSIVENTEDGKIYTLRERKIERFKESFDDFFSFSRRQMEFRSCCLVPPIFITLHALEDSNDVSFNFFYKEKLELFNKTQESLNFKEHQGIRFLEKVNKSLEFLRTKGFYFPDFSLSNVFFDPETRNLVLLGFEHESRFIQDKLGSSIHKQNMNAMGKMVQTLMCGSDNLAIPEFTGVFKQILMPVLNKNEDECPNSFEFLLFLKKAKTKRLKEIFFFKPKHPTLILSNFSICMSVDKEIFLLKESGEMKMIGNLEGKSPTFNSQSETLISFEKSKFHVFNFGMEKERSVNLPSSQFFNCISFDERVFLVGGSKQGLFGKVFTPEIYLLKGKSHEFQKLEDLPARGIDGELFLFAMNSRIYAIGHSPLNELTHIFSLSFQGESLLFQKWTHSSFKWKNRASSEILTFFAPHNCLLFVGLLESSGSLFSLESEKSVEISIKWQVSNCELEAEKLRVGRGFTWDGNISRVLAAGSKEVFLFTSKVNLPHSALVVVKST